MAPSCTNLEISGSYFRIFLWLFCDHEDKLEVVGAEGHVEQQVNVHTEGLEHVISKNRRHFSIIKPATFPFCL